ncbi:hypothetical protein AB0C93_27245 [Streptomyces sp. NPDC048518]
MTAPELKAERLSRPRTGVDIVKGVRMDVRAALVDPGGQCGGCLIHES